MNKEENIFSKTIKLLEMMLKAIFLKMILPKIEGLILMTKIKITLIILQKSKQFNLILLLI